MRPHEPSRLTLNGSAVELNVDPARRLLHVLRDDLDLTGTKHGCGEGLCGSCTVLVDGQAARACLTEMGGLAGRSVTTIEGLADGDRLHPLQEEFIRHGALQCGFCTPGMIMSAAGLLQARPGCSREDARRHLEGNLCRCGTHQRVLEAVASAAGRQEGTR